MRKLTLALALAATIVTGGAGYAAIWQGHADGQVAGSRRGAIFTDSFYTGEAPVAGSRRGAVGTDSFYTGDAPVAGSRRGAALTDSF